MATAASASSAALRSKTPGPAPSAHPSPKPSLAVPRPSPGASSSTSGRLHASPHLGGSRINGTGLHVVQPEIMPLAVPRMAGGAGAEKSILLYNCEEMRDLAEQMFDFLCNLGSSGFTILSPKLASVRRPSVPAAPVLG